jgi:hypothetical protein
MTDTATVPPPERPSGDNVLTRLVGVIFSPRATFERIVARPTWVAALLLTAGLIAAVSFAFLSTEVGQTALLDQQVRQTESWGIQVSAEQYQQMEHRLPIMRYVVAGSQLVGALVVTVALAGILFGIFNSLLGGNARYKQVVAVVTFSGAISLLHQLFLAPLNYARASMSSATNLGVFVPFLDDTNIIARFLGAIDLFIIWWLVVLAIGVAVLYRRKTAPIFWSLMGVYVVIALVIAVAMRGASGGA